MFGTRKLARFSSPVGVVNTEGNGIVDTGTSFIPSSSCHFTLNLYFADVGIPTEGSLEKTCSPNSFVTT